MDHVLLILMVLLPLVAFLYASVGHGGASSYLVLLTLFRFAPEQVRSTALLLNIAVALIAFLSFRKACVFPSKLFLSLIIFSVPASFLGGLLSVDAFLYRKILGVLLLFPVLRLFNLLPVRKNKMVIERSAWMIPLLGISIGFISGLVGIGGGILLSPLLLLMGWTDVKETAAISALFIFFNSIAGFIASFSWSAEPDSRLYFLLLLAVTGGLAGAYYGARRFRIPALKYLLAAVLLIASTKFIVT